MSELLKPIGADKRIVVCPYVKLLTWTDLQFYRNQLGIFKQSIGATIVVAFWNTGLKERIYCQNIRDLKTTSILL